jgi:hypothetical protein
MLLAKASNDNASTRVNLITHKDGSVDLVFCPEFPKSKGKYRLLTEQIRE